jgi:hypothetical protein
MDDPVALVVNALAAGVVRRAEGNVPIDFAEAYWALKELTRRRLAGRPDGELILSRYENAPKAWEERLKVELGASEADSDRNLVAAAQFLTRLVDATVSQAGKYAVESHHSQGVLIGDHGTQDNTYIDTYIQTQVIHSSANPAGDASKFFGKDRVSEKRRITAERVRAAALLSQMDRNGGRSAYAEIAHDRHAHAGERVRAAALLTQMDAPAGASAYAEIAHDRNARAADRVRAAQLLTLMDRNAGKSAYAEIAHDRHARAADRVRAAQLLTQMDAPAGASAYAEIAADQHR